MREIGFGRFVMTVGEIAMTRRGILMRRTCVITGPHRRLLMCGGRAPMGIAGLDMLGGRRGVGEPGAVHGFVGALARQQQ
jgi:hypothetical protein